ncbi:transporter [Moraxella sp. FZFQ2102]|uniref:transporter n=1 Tax=Moraxella sp. FZFQ2102 TaxID=2953752 RepID=UPI00209BBE46|nr:transporter [Moraxella sp. FZFQ2102]USZ14711.1 transporter [Moraxella sp. FZFQ2102]
MTPAGTNALLVYQQFATTDRLREQGKTASDQFGLDTSMTVLRYFHTFGINERSTLDLDTFVPFVKATGKHDAAGIDISGVADWTVTTTYRRKLNENNDALILTGLLSLPTGSCELSSDRLSLDVQAGYVKNFGKKWSMDVTGDVIFYGKDSHDFKKDVSFESQLIGRYHIDDTLSLGTGLWASVGRRNQGCRWQQTGRSPAKHQYSLNSVKVD